jgi:purine-binding chemotaxis protein CheW
MNQEKKKSYEEKQLVVFKLAKEEFGVDISQVREIIKMEQITKIPNTLNYIKGVINLRGGIIVVIDLSMKLNLLSKEVDKDTRIIVIEVENNTIGMIVDSATEVIRLNADEIQGAPEVITKKINANYMDGVGIIGERLLILLDLAKVLQSKDVATIQQIQKQSNDISHLVNDNNKINKQKNDNEHPTLKDVDESFHFKTHEGNKIKNVHELLDYVKSFDESVFQSFVNEERNDFYEWIKNAVKDNDLAEKIKLVKSKNDVTKEIMHKILEIKLQN